MSLPNSRPEAISLQWVLGANSTAVFALRPASGVESSGQRIFYISGNVGVIYDAGAKTQTLLRGHRNPLKAALVDDDKHLIVTACAGRESSIIFWDAVSGDPVGMIESPHAGGTSAMAFTADGRYLATLSVPGPAIADNGEAGVQEVSVWDCGSVWAAIGRPCADWSPLIGAQDDGSAVPQLCTSAVVPCSDEQRYIAVSRQPAPVLLTPGRAEPGREGGTIGSAWEMVTTGLTSVVFWAATRCELKDPDTAARMGSTALQASLKAGKKYPTKDVWYLACDAPKVPRAPPSEIPGMLPVPGPLAGRTLSQSIFLPGSRAEHLSTVDAMAAESKSSERGEDAGLGVGSMSSMSTFGSPSRGRSRGGDNGTGGGSKSMSPGKRGAANPLGSIMLKAPTGARVSALTATSEGLALLWQTDFMESEVESAMTRGARAAPGSGIASAAAIVVRRSCLKVMDLKAPNFTGEVPSAANAHSYRINTVRATPSGNSVVVGSEDGAVRIFDLNMKLMGWFEDLGAGPLTALDFVPGTSGAELTASGEPQPGLPAKHTLADVPDLVVASRRCMMLGLATAAFDTVSPTDETRRGTVLLEGPDAPVTGLATYPHAARLAVAVASGVLQVWDTQSKALLVMRELRMPAEQDAAGVAGGHFYHPMSLAVDPLGRFVAVGTAEGYLLILSPDDLSDVQAAIPHPHYPRRGSPLTRLVFSPDGYHLAAGDDSSHVLLYRFVRQVSRRLVDGIASTTAANRLASRRPWETVIPEADRFEEVIVDAWSYIGQVKAHSQPITGLSFSHLPPGAVSLPPGRGMGAVQGFSGHSFWLADTNEDSEVAARHASAGLAQLASVGADRKLCLFDVGGASVSGGVPVRASRTSLSVERGGARPTCALWLPPRGACPALATDYSASTTGASLVIPSDAFKMRVWNCEGLPRQSRMVLAPTFGGAVTHTALLPAHPAPGAKRDEGKEEDAQAAGWVAQPAYAVAYATDDRIVGVARLPLDGSPYGYVGVVGHTGPVSAMAASADGSQLFSAGLDSAGSSHTGEGMSIEALLTAGCGSVCIWAIHEDVVHAGAAEGGTGIAPFLSLLEGGSQGQKYSDICDMFSYAQIRAQGESSTAPRLSGVGLPVSELPAVMRGLGYFPSAADAEGMAEEAVLSMADARALSGAQASVAESVTVDLQTVLRLFVNHKPVRSVRVEDVKRALYLLGSRADPEDTDENGGMRWGGLARILAQHGEKLGAEELAVCLTGLLGSDVTGAATAAAAAAAAGVPLLDDDDMLTADDVAGKVLGMYA